MCVNMLHIYVNEDILYLYVCIEISNRMFLYKKLHKYICIYIYTDQLCVCITMYANSEAEKKVLPIHSYYCHFAAQKCKCDPLFLYYF